MEKKRKEDSKQMSVNKYRRGDFRLRHLHKSYGILRNKIGVIKRRETHKCCKKLKNYLRN